MSSVARIRMAKYKTQPLRPETSNRFVIQTFLSFMYLAGFRGSVRGEKGFNLAFDFWVSGLEQGRIQRHTLRNKLESHSRGSGSVTVESVCKQASAASGSGVINPGIRC